MNDEKTNRYILRLLYRLRYIALTSLLFIIVILIYPLNIALNLVPILSLIASLLFMNGLVFLRLKNPFKVTSVEITLNLTFDTLILAILLYFNGGSTNPIVSLLIIPVTLSAAFLPIISIIWITALSISLYSFLMKWYLPLPPMGMQFGGDFNMHIIGMYGNFIFSAIIIAIFVYILAHLGRKKDQALHHAKEKIMRNEQIVKMGLLAANAAHEINTPLSTIALLTEELLETNQKNQQIEDLKQIQRQIQYCKKQLQYLQNKATIDEFELPLSLKTAILESINNGKIKHPNIQINFTFQLAEDKLMKHPSPLIMTLTHLINNATEASLQAGQTKINISVEQNKTQLIIHIDDYGMGLSPQQLEKIGKKPYTSKQQGMGMGLLLSHSSLADLGGVILLNNHLDRGVRASMFIPLEEFNL